MEQGSPAPGPQAGTGPQPARNWALEASDAPSTHVWDAGSMQNHASPFGPWKNRSPWNWFMVGAAVIEDDQHLNSHPKDD